MAHPLDAITAPTLSEERMKADVSITEDGICSNFPNLAKAIEALASK